MIAPMSFLRMQGSISSGEYPLLQHDQDLEPMTLEEYRQVHYVDGLQTHADVPSFVGYDSCNVVKIGDLYYWVTDWRESTGAQHSIDFSLRIMGPTSMFRENDTIRGVWRRTPTNVCPNLNDEISNTAIGHTNKTVISRLDVPDLDDDTRTFWLQVTGHDANGTLNQFGGFVIYDTASDGFSWSATVPQGETLDYPSYGEWVSDIFAITGMTAEQIDDISISRRCPYSCSLWNGTRSYITIDSLSGVDVPVSTRQTSGGHMRNVYSITQLRSLASTIDIKPNMATITMSRTVNERNITDFNLVDWNGNTVCNVNPHNKDTFTINLRMFSDTSGIYMIVTVPDSRSYIIPEGKLTWYGDTNDTYRAYQMNSDRQAMEFAIQNAAHDKQTAQMSAIGNAASSALSGITMGALTGNPLTAASGGLSGAIGGITDYWSMGRTYEIEVMQANQTAELAKRRAIEQPGASFSPGYGEIYAFLNINNPLSVTHNRPLGLLPYDNTYISSWRANFGYPAQGEIGLNAVTGFYQGKLLSSTRMQTGPIWDECNKIFQQGFKFINP